MKEIIYTIPMMAKMLRVSPQYLTQLIRTGHLEAFKLGRDWVVTEDNLDKLMKKRVKKLDVDNVA